MGASTLIDAPNRTVLAPRSRARVFEAYLTINPLALALFRAAELRPLHQLLERPVLDIGCGSGDFAEAAFDDRIDIGIDICETRVIAARQCNAYYNADCGDATALPYPSESFGTVVSISVLEHIEDVPEVLAEAMRVLKPDGAIVFSVVLSDIHRLSAGARLLRWCGFAFAGDAVNRLHDIVFRHKTLWSESSWIRAIEQAGFVDIETTHTVSARLLVWFELSLVAAIPYRLLMALGRPWSWRPQWLSNVLVRSFRSMVESDCDDGACLFIRARRPKADSSA